MPHIVIMRSVPVRYTELFSRDIVFIAIDDRPQRSLLARKLAREDAGLQRRHVRLPVRAHQIFRKRALDTRESAHALSIMRRHAVPEAPEIFERRVADAVEESMLKAVGLVAREAISNVDHVARLETLSL